MQTNTTSQFRPPISDLRSPTSDLRPPLSAARSAFSLTELLVVITIIAILASLTSAAVMNALWGTRQARIKVEGDQLDTAMKAFKEKYGAFPPAYLGLDANTPTSNLQLKTFVARAFPRYNQASLKADMTLAGADTDPAHFNPAQALVFWLRGFSPDVAHPFTGPGARVPLYGFEKTRLISADTAYPGGFNDTNGNGVFDPDPINNPGEYAVPMVYVPPGGEGAPYLYIDYRSYADNGGTAVAAPRMFQWPPTWMSNSNATPSQACAYVLDVDKSGATSPGDTWCNPDSFQIISAGQDGLFGTTTTTSTAIRYFPTAVGYTEFDNDNVTNFTDRHNLDDARP